MNVTLIVAHTYGGVIGVDGKLPWYIPEDLKYFKCATDNKVVVMGRKTFESIGKPLPNRTNIVLSSSYDVPKNGVIIEDGLWKTNSIVNALNAVKDQYEVCIIGGSEIYTAAWPYVTKIRRTLVRHSLKNDVDLPLSMFREYKHLDSDDWEAQIGDWINDYYRFDIFYRKSDPLIL